jgi:hypothetical protein
MSPWIPVRKDLQDDPKTQSIAERLNIPPAHVVGLLVRFWSWADGQTDDGILEDCTPKIVDRLVGHEGFAGAMIGVRWLQDEGDAGLRLPLYDRYLGRSAKSRALTAERMRRHRKSCKRQAY